MITMETTLKTVIELLGDARLERVGDYIILKDPKRGEYGSKVSGSEVEAIITVVNNWMTAREFGEQESKLIEAAAKHERTVERMNEAF